MRKEKIWTSCFIAIFVICAVAIGALVFYVDPFFHYHKPLTDRFYYRLNNERSQNDGILKHFDYDAVIAGTSMTENFQTSELDALFGTNSVKVPSSGGPYKEINDNLNVALTHQPDVRLVVRVLDQYMLTTDKDYVRDDQGTYPVYLYDDNWYNDVQYLFNRDVLFKRVIPMLWETRNDDFIPGITEFDAYANWSRNYSYGKNSVLAKASSFGLPGQPIHLTEVEAEKVRGNIRQNVTELAQAYPDVTFYYFLPPYSAYYWECMVESGAIYRQIEAEQIAIEEILQYDNIRLFSFDLMTDITTDLNNYKDSEHYGDWINSAILIWMYDDLGRLTQDNYVKYLTEKLDFYCHFDYNSLFLQEDLPEDGAQRELFSDLLRRTE